MLPTSILLSVAVLAGTAMAGGPLQIYNGYGMNLRTFENRLKTQDPSVAASTTVPNSMPTPIMAPGSLFRRTKRQQMGFIYMSKPLNPRAYSGPKQKFKHLFGQRPGSAQDKVDGEGTMPNQQD